MPALAQCLCLSVLPLLHQRPFTLSNFTPSSCLRHEAREAVGKLHVLTPHHPSLPPTHPCRSSGPLPSPTPSSCGWRQRRRSGSYATACSACWASPTRSLRAAGSLCCARERRRRRRFGSLLRSRLRLRMIVLMLMLKWQGTMPGHACLALAWDEGVCGHGWEPAAWPRPPTLSLLPRPDPRRVQVWRRGAAGRRRGRCQQAGRKPPPLRPPGAQLHRFCARQQEPAAHARAPQQQAGGVAGAGEAAAHTRLTRAHAARPRGGCSHAAASPLRPAGPHLLHCGAAP